MSRLTNVLYYVSSISWNETSCYTLINNDALQKSEYVEAPSDLKGDEICKFIDQKLIESSGVAPWYYNVEIVD